jgi:lipoprotein NlpD
MPSSVQNYRPVTPVCRWTFKLVFLVLSALICIQLLSACGAQVRPKGDSTERPKVREGHRPVTYKVRSGDTLYSIAWRYGLDYHVLARWNGIKRPYTIYAGQTLRLRQTGTKSSGKTATKKKTAPSRSPEKAVTPRPQTTRKTSKPAAKGSSGQQAVASGKGLNWKWPTQGKVKKGYSASDPARQGIEIGGRTGQRIVASESGRVVYAGSGLIGYGRLVIIKHNNNYLSAYGRNRKLLVQEGAQVKRGQAIAEMGNNGNGGPSLHFEIRKNGDPMNPLKLLPGRR